MAPARRLHAEEAVEKAAREEVAMELRGAGPTRTVVVGSKVAPAGITTMRARMMPAPTAATESQLSRRVPRADLKEGVRSLSNSQSYKTAISGTISLG